MDNLIEWFNPAYYGDPEAYLAWWQSVLDTLFTGMTARLLASVMLFYSFWYGVYKQRFAVGMVFFLAAYALAYGASLSWLFAPRP
ncbi:MAG: hypothetical protein AB1411_02665 [Nitrospirota bacterium]